MPTKFGPSVHSAPADPLEQEARDAGVMKCNVQLSELTHERRLRWEPKLTEASLGGACIPRYIPVPGMRSHLIPERFRRRDTGASQDSAATAPPARAEAQTQTLELPPNEVARTLLGLYGDKDDDLSGSPVDLAEPDRRDGEAEKEYRDNPDLMDSGVANVAMAEHGFSQMAIANQPQFDIAPSQGFAETLQRGKDITEDVVFESPPPGRESARKTTVESEVPERSVSPKPPPRTASGVSEASERPPTNTVLGERRLSPSPPPLQDFGERALSASPQAAATIFESASGKTDFSPSPPRFIQGETIIVERPPAHIGDTVPNVKTEVIPNPFPSGLRKGNSPESSLRDHAIPWRAPMEGASVDPTLGEDIVTLSQCGPLSLSEFLPQTPKQHVVHHGADIVGPVAFLPFGKEGFQGGSNRGVRTVCLVTGDHALPSISKEADLLFFDQARGSEHQHLLWSLPGMYETLLEEVQVDGPLVVPFFSVMAPSSHPVNTSKVQDWLLIPELYWRAASEDPKNIARMLRFVQAVARYRCVSSR
jgi:hypothetical protein